MTTTARIALLLAAVSLASPGSSVMSQDATGAKIAELERRLAAGGFDYALHNELRHLYGGVDPRKSMGHADAILKARRFDGYMKQVLGGNDPDPRKAADALLAVARRYPDLPDLAATCLAWAGDLDPDPAAAGRHYRAALATRGAAAGLRAVVEDRVRFDPAARRPWPARIPPPPGLEKTPGPWSDPADVTSWPNTTSRANSDPWLVANHDKLRVMRPRLLLVNFSNEHPRDHLDRLAKRITDALAESTRYHGYEDPAAPAFLRYEVFKFVDLRDADRTTGNSRHVPVKDPAARRGFNMKYRDYFSDAFAKLVGVPDPREPGRFLRLDELLDGGYVHEVWFFESGNVRAEPHVGSYEVVEQKPRYTDTITRAGRAWVQAGNGGDDDQPWVGRSCRIGCINASRGPGCFLESLAHGLEGTANSGAVPYFTKYFHEYADFNLNARYKLPFRDLYGVAYGDRPVRYPDEKTAVITHSGKEYRVENYVPVGGSAHFPPNARGHYDLDNDRPVLCTMADWRTAGPGGTDRARPYSRDVIRNNRDLYPDCMGPWLVYWRQNMPGLGNRQKVDGGAPMKNWWPFLFY